MGDERDLPVEPGVVEEDPTVSDIPFCKLPNGNVDLLRNWKTEGVSPGYPASSPCDSDDSSMQSGDDDDE